MRKAWLEPPIASPAPHRPPPAACASSYCCMASTPAGPQGHAKQAAPTQAQRPRGGSRGGRGLAAGCASAAGFPPAACAAAWCPPAAAVVHLSTFVL